MGKYWLIEYPSSSLCSVYLTEAGQLTFDPWKAKRFVHLGQARRWMTTNEPSELKPQPWTTVPYSFEKTTPIIKLKPRLMDQLLQGAAV